VRFPSGATRKLLAARIVAAVMLVLALVSGIAPFGASSSASLCAMACCAGKPPHEAGACAGVSCHAHLSTRREEPPPKPKPKTHCEMSGGGAPDHQEMARIPDALTIDSTVATEHLDGEDHLATAQSDASQNAPRQASIIVTAAAISNPCRPDCGAGVFNSSVQGRQRSSAVISYAGQPRPPCGEHLFLTNGSPARALSALCRKCVPRGPPVLFS
jgi:hypothetical protein